MSQKNLEFDYHVKLAFPLDSGRYVTEYIPRDYTEIENWLHARFDNLRMKTKIPLYYWDIRWLLHPPERKLYDIHFLLHVANDHQDQKLALIERFHAWRLRRHYKHELPLLLKLHANGPGKQNNTDIMLQTNPYETIYYKKWLKSFKEDDNWRILYHGVDLGETIDLLDLLIYKNEYRAKALADSKKTN